MAIVDNLISSDDGTIEVHPFIKKELLIGEPEIFGWQYNESVFKGVPNGRINPKPFSSDLKIKYFKLRSPNKFTATLKLSNILLSSADIELLKHALMGDVSGSIPYETVLVK